MKLHAGTNVIEKSGNFEESRFSIEASSKAFFILSDGLYSNKILAVVRELSTNAYDSHVDAGKRDVPFDVHLPTVINPTFFIRDYGTSMDHENCMQLYTTYFRSTRNNSNDAVGCLGLGSKAPFAYSDSFTVEAYLNGKRRLYNAYKNEDGSPVFSLMHEDDTSEPNGIKVCIQVNSNDVTRFNLEAKKVYEFFKVRPNFIGEKIAFDKVDKVLAGDGWYFDDNASSNLIIMGQIAYPIDHFQIMSGDENKESKFIQHSSGLRMFVNIGDVDITPSRESLSYSRETKSNIKNIINKITSEIASKIEDQIKSQPTLYKARIKYVQISDQCSSIKNAIESLQKSITWNGQKLFDNIINESVSVKDKLSITLLSKSWYRKKIDTSKDVESISFDSDIKFYIDDLTRGGLSRIKQHIRDSNGQGEKKCYLYKLKDGETVDNNALYDILGGATKEDVTFTSNLPKIQYNRNGNGRTLGDGLPAVQIQMYNEETGLFEECSMSVKYENAYYFKESKGEVSIGYHDVSISQIESALTYMHQNYAEEIDGMTFYIIKPSVIKNRKLCERDNWFDAVDVMLSIFNKAVENHKQDIIDCKNRLEISNHRNDKFVNVFKFCKIHSEPKKIIEEYNEYGKRISAMHENMNLIHHMSRIIPGCNTVDFSQVKVDRTKFSIRFDNSIKKYPMLSIISNFLPYGNIGDSDAKKIADYIDMIECSENMSNVLSSM
jgi:hypothetical protein